MQLSQDLVDGVKIIVDNILKKGSYDKTYTGKIKAINSNGTYDVVINTKTYTLPLYYKRNLILNDTIKVIVPLNNFKNAFIL